MKVTIIGIAGGSGSGKSTFTGRLKEAFGDEIAVVCQDDYYRRQDNRTPEERRKVNYDHPDALETELLAEHLKALKRGEAIDCPQYDYTVHNRSGKIRHVEPRPVVLVEGILLFTDKRIRDILDMKIYVDADADERILRRVRRDTEERGRQVADIMEQYLSTVKPMHNRYVEPTRRMADLVLNSGQNNLAFAVMENYVRALLNQEKTIDEDFLQ